MFRFEMPLTKLPDGSYIDPEHNPVGSIFKRAPSPELNITGWAIVVLSKMCQYVFPCADEAEADAKIDAVAAMLGYCPGPSALDGALGASMGKVN
jgi:hypothetical protein